MLIKSPEKETQPMQSNAGKFSPGPVEILLLIWLAGAVGLGVFALGCNFRLWRIVKSRRLVTEGEILDLLEDCKGQMGIRTVLGLVVTDKVKSPALFGVIRPRLLLPEGMIEKLNNTQLRYVFLHELGHLKRHDIYLGWVMVVLQVLHWFNPLVWFAFHRMRADRELACDGLVLSTMGADESHRYGQTIVNLFKGFSQIQYVPGIAGIMENKNQLKRRIMMITRFKRGSYRWSVLAVVLLAVLSSIALTKAQGTTQANKADVPSVSKTVKAEGKSDSWVQIDNAPNNVREIGKVLKEWFDAYRADDFERAKKLQHPEMMEKFEKNLEATEHLLRMIGDEPLLLMAVIQGGEGAHVAAGTKSGIFFLGEPHLIGGVFNKFQGQWRINNISGAKLEMLEKFIEEWKKKSPDVNVWLSDSFSKLSGQADTILKKKAEAFEKTKWEQLDGASKQVQDIADVLRKWYKSCSAGNLEEAKAVYTTNSREKAEKQLTEFKRFAVMAPDWNFSPMAIMQDGDEAKAVSEPMKINHPQVAEPVVLIINLKREENRWKILSWSADMLKKFPDFALHHKRTHPDGQIWLEDSAPGLTSLVRNAITGSEDQQAISSSAVKTQIILLYHKDRDVRKQAVQTLGLSGDVNLIDDLIRAHSVENYTPVHNEYGKTLNFMTGQKKRLSKGGWKAWLMSEVEAGRLKIDYLPIEPDPNHQSSIEPFILLGPGNFDEMAAILTTKTYDRRKCRNALKYMVFNDHLPDIQKFLAGDWLSKLFSHRNININDIGYDLNGLANPGYLREQINNQVRNCLNSDNPIVVANALNLIAGVKGFSTRFTVPGVEKKIEELLSSSAAEVALQAQQALERIKPKEKRNPTVESTFSQERWQQFDGRDDYVEVPNSPNLNFGTGDFSVEFWIKAPFGQDATVIGKGGEVPKSVAWNIQVENTQIHGWGIRLDMYDGTYGTYNIVNSLDAIDNTWHHVTFVMDRDTNAILYIDGIQKDSGNIAGIDNINNSYPLLIGKRGDGWGVSQWYD